jgi:hypothetical protein
MGQIFRDGGSTMLPYFQSIIFSLMKNKPIVD